MNAIHATPRIPTTVSIACPWCDEPLAVEDAFTAPAVRCGSCATSIDLEWVKTPERSAGVDPARPPERSAGVDPARTPERSAGVDPARTPERSAGVDPAVAVAA